MTDTVSVPREPTEAMLEAFYGAVEILPTGTIRGFLDGWEAMLAASPQGEGSPIGQNDQPGLAFSDADKGMMTAQELAEHAQFAFENDLPDDFTPYDCAMAWRRVGEHLAAVLAERAEDGGMRDTNPSNQSIKEIAAQLQQYAANTLKP